MSGNNHRHTLLKSLLWLFLLAVVALFIKDCERTISPEELYFDFRSDTLDCSIAMERSYKSSQHKNVAFNYELLGAFGEGCGSHIRILTPENSPECWENLEKGSLDVVVCSLKDSIPEEYRGRFLFSVPVKESDVWVVRGDNIKLMNSINFWYTKFQFEDLFSQMKVRYFRSYKIDYLLSMDGPVKSISPYDDIIKKYSANVGLDWRLISAIIYEESQFAIGAQSPFDARGLMQIKESTAAAYGVSDLYDPEMNVKAGTLHFDKLLKQIRKEGLDSINVVKFALAAYNGGEGNLKLLRDKAAEQGADRNDWDSVRAKLERPDGPIPSYIDNILERYEVYKSVIE